MIGVDDAEEKLAKKMGDSLEGEISHKIAEFGGLLSRGAAIRLLCSQNGIETEKPLALSDTAGAILPFRFHARVDRIFPMQVFSNGVDKSVRLHLSDRSGSATLVLWNDWATRVDEGWIGTGDEIECRGAHYRAGEITLGRGGNITKVSAFPLTPIARLSNGICSTGGTAKDAKKAAGKAEPWRADATFMLCENGKCVPVNVWNDAPLPPEGSTVRLENAVFKNNELHCNAHSRLVVLFGRTRHSGRLSLTDARGENALLEISGRKFVLPIMEALLLLGIREVPPGVLPSTALALRSSEYLGKEVKYEENCGRLSWLSL